LSEEGWDGSDESSIPIIIHEILMVSRNNTDIIKSAIDVGFYVSISSTASFFDVDSAIHQDITNCLSLIPLNKMLVCSNSPWNTPQNIPDSYICSQRNESSNIPFTYSVIGSHCTPVIAALDLAKQTYNTAVKIFNLTSTEDGNCKADNSDVVSKAFDSENVDKNNTKVSFDTNEEDIDIVENTAIVKSTSDMTQQYYCCTKCRKRIFDKSEAIYHDIADMKTVFRVGEEVGACRAVIFLPESILESSTTIASDETSTISCKNCGSKMGKLVYDGAVQCPCGATICGPVLRITTSKVDFVDATLSTTDLASRALKEMTIHSEESNQAMDEIMQKKLEQKELKKSTKKKKEKSIKAFLNKGNYSVFRDKTFVTSASRQTRNNTGGPVMSKKKGDGNNRRGNDSDSNSDDSNDEDER
jgi:hypothetical protein